MTLTDAYEAQTQLTEYCQDLGPEALWYIFCRGAWATVCCLVGTKDHETRADANRYLAGAVADPTHPATRPPRALTLMTVEACLKEEIKQAGRRVSKAERVVVRAFYYAGARYVTTAARGDSPGPHTWLDRTAYDTVKLEVAHANGYAHAPEDWHPDVDPDAQLEKMG